MDRDITIYQCFFELYAEKATVLIKFPCNFFLQWKTSNGKKSVEGKSQPTSVNSQVNFQQHLQLTTQLIFDNNSNQFLKKQSLLNLNLISKSRKDQVKLVGRVGVDLAEVANRGSFQQLKTYRLAYCSVDADISFSTVMKVKKVTNLNLQDLDKSSFNQYISFYSCNNNHQTKLKKESTREDLQHETSIGYGRKTFENVIDMPQIEPKKSPRQFNQTFFVLPSPRQNGMFNRTGELLPKISSRQKSLEAQTVLSIQQLDQPIKNYSQGRSNYHHRESQNWEQDRSKFRDEIDKNKFKIQELQKKILELCSNLESSKRHLELTEKENRQKEEIIKKLKNSVNTETQQKQQNIYELEYRFEKIVSEKKDQERKFRQIQQGLKKQLLQNQINIQNLRKETEELRKMWNEKRSHFEQKISYCQGLIRQKDKKINQLGLKLQEMNKFKYQYDLLKELNVQKESKIKIVEKDLVKMSRQLEQIKQNNLAEENYKIKLNNAQLLKNIEELNQKYIKCQEQVSKFRENYIKIQTAYQIQTKNYQNTKQKYNQMQNNYFSIQKENIQNKNSLLHSQRQLEELEKKNIDICVLQNKLTNDLQNNKKVIEQTKQQFKAILQEKNQYKNAIQKLRIEQEIRISDYEKQMKRMEATFNSSLQLKQNNYNKQKKQLQDSIRKLQNQLVKKQAQIASKIQEKETEFTKLKGQFIIKEQQINKILSNVKALEQSVIDKQEIIKLCKQENQSLKNQNNELSDSVSKMKQKQQQLQENITILQEQSQKILYILQLKQQTDVQLEKLKQTCKILNEENIKIKDHITQQASLKETVQLQNQELLKKIQEKQQESQLKNNELEQQKRLCSSLQEQLAQSKKQMDKMREIVKEINDRYEEHMKTEQRYVQEIENIRYQKQEIEREMNTNSNQLASHNNILQTKIQSLQEEIEKYENQTANFEQQKRNLQNMLNENSQTEFLLKSKQQQFQTKIANYQKKYSQIQNILSQNQQKIKLSNHQHQQSLLKITNLEIIIAEKQKTLKTKDNQNSQIKVQNTRLNEIAQALSKQKNQIQHRIAQLQHELESIKQKINQNIPSGAQIAKSKLIFGDQQIFSKREDQLQQLLLQSDRKNQNLQSKIQALQLQISNIVVKTHSEETPLLYSSFTQFQREQMSKLIQQQRCEIDRLSIQIKKNATNDSSILIKRISELQSHIQALESSFKLQIDRIIGQQPHKDSFNNGLMVINEEMNDDQMYRSERSLRNSVSRVKSSIDVIQLIQLKQKLQIIQEEKSQLQQQFGAMEQQKFNLLSTINEKDIQIQDITHAKELLVMQIEEIKLVNEDYIKKIKNLQIQIQNLKNQANFGSTLNNYPICHSITRSQPIKFDEQQNYLQSKIMEKQNLMVEIDRLKNRQQQLLWNVKDLQMQLENVTENLNILNGSSMNSVLQSTRKIILQDQSQQSIKLFQTEQGYSKEKLLHNLKKNQQLKQLAHNLIRNLKKRQNEQKERSYMFKSILNGHQNMTGSLNYITQGNGNSLNSKLSTLFNQFRLIKLYVLKNDSQREEINLTNSRDIMKDILAFEQGLKEVKSIFQQSSKIQYK